MTNEIWIKSPEREAFDKIMFFITEHMSGEFYEEFCKLLATYRKRAFDAGVFECARNQRGNNAAK